MSTGSTMKPGRHANVKGPAARTDSHPQRGAAESDGVQGPRQKPVAKRRRRHRSGITRTVEVLHRPDDQQSEPRSQEER